MEEGHKCDLIKVSLIFLQIEVSHVHHKTKQTLIRISFSMLLIGSFLATSGCNEVKKESQGRPWAMGEKVALGPFTYTVLDSEWVQELNGSKGKLIPKERFLVLRLSVTNGGGEQKSVSYLHVRDDKGKEFPEVQEMEGVKDWMGILRMLPVAGTENGLLVFDVPMGHYRLVVNDGGSAGEERTSLIDLPLNMRPSDEMTPIMGK